MPWYALSTTTMISHLSLNTTNIHQVWLADDAAGAGKIKNLHSWYNILKEVGKHHGYEVNGSKSWLICKTEEVAAEATQVFGDTVNVTTEGMRHLGAVIGAQGYKDKYCTEKVEKWAGTPGRNRRNRTTSCLYCILKRLQIKIHLFS